MASESIQLSVNFSNTWLPVLSIPIADCHRFALKPLRWLRFLGYVIYGRQGHISTSPNGPNVDYESPVQAGSIYYFISPDAPRFLDTHCIDDRTSIVYRGSDADSTESHAEFHDALEERDGTCVITDDPGQLCNAAHYWPHAKGSEYICRVMAIRGGPPDLTDINDVRNGLLLTPSIHTLFGLGEVGFLKTPNFALSDDSDDIPPSPLPVCGSQSNPPGRLILQHFIEQSHRTATLSYPHNQDARQPTDMNNFPPPVITDMLYGCAALLRWGNDQTTGTIGSSVRSSYYDSVGLRGPSGDCDLDGGHYSYRDKKSQPKDNLKVTELDPRAKKRANRAKSRPQLRTMNDALDFLMMLSYKLESRNQDSEGTSPSREENLSRDKVNRWLQNQ